MLPLPSLPSPTSGHLLCSTSGSKKGSELVNGRVTRNSRK